MNLPNLITIGRILLVPVFLGLVYAGGKPAAVGALAVFLAASLSDSLDGYVARRNDTVSKTGQFLDPLADKVLVGAALVALVGLRRFPLWAALLIAFREVAVQLLRTQLARGGNPMPASAFAKAKTATQIAMVSWWLLPWEPNIGHWLLLAAGLVTTLGSGFEYFRAAQQVPERQRLNR